MGLEGSMSLTMTLPEQERMRSPIMGQGTALPLSSSM